MSHTRMSQERHAEYVDRRQRDRERTLTRRQARYSKQAQRVIAGGAA